ELLHTVGASDRYVAGQFQRHALLGGIKGGIIGFALAALTVLLLRLPVSGAPSGQGISVILPDLALSAGDWLLLCLVPALAALIAMFTARFTVLRKLSNMV